MIRTRDARLWTALIALCSLAAAHCTRPETRAALGPRLERLAAELERERERLHIPGMALVVVQGDELVLARGFGEADLERHAPVTPETVFAIGSSTKAFTAALVGMLVDEGLMHWQDPVTRFLPEFKLDIDEAGTPAEVTLRDLLSHRTGFARMDVLWPSGELSRAEVLQAAARARPLAPFRKSFHYSNVIYTAAGAAAEQATHESWEKLIEERIFAPLGMRDSATGTPPGPRPANWSAGYRWDADVGRVEAVAPLSLAAIAPAGAIHSSAVDMSRWLRFQLQGGSFGGKALLSRAQHEETWTAQIQLAPGVGYGLGWMLGDVNGHRIVYHGGNVPGFSAQVALVPDAELGFALLSNLSATPLQGLSLGLVVERLLGPAASEEPPPVGASGESLEPYTGRYEADFGSFHGAHFTVSAREGRLAVDVPGQTAYELRPPDAEGKWRFVATDAIAVSFERDARGAVRALRMYQGGLTFELPREGVEPAAEIDPAALERYLGSYQMVGAATRYSVVLSHKRLAVDVPGQRVYELYPPDAKQRWVFRATAELSVSFRESEAGTVEALVLHQDGRDVELRRLPGLAAGAPSVADVLALRPPTSPDAVRVHGRLHMVHAGVDGEITVLAQGSARYRSDIDLGRLGRSRTALSESGGQTDSSVSGPRELRGRFLRQARILEPLLFGDLREYAGALRVLRSDSLSGVAVHVLELSAAELPPLLLYLDARSGDLLQSETSLVDPDSGIAVPVVARYADYRDAGGRRLPWRYTVSDPESGETVVQVDAVEPLPDPGPERFSLAPGAR